MAVRTATIETVADAPIIRRAPQPAGSKTAVALWSGVTAILLALDVTGPLTAVFLGVALVIVPGVFVVEFASPRGATERIVIVAAISLTFWMIVAHLLLTFEWWQPRLVAATILIAATIVAALWIGPTSAARPIRGRLPDLVTHLGTAQLAWSGGALALWAVSLPWIDTDDFGDWGLVTNVPPTFFLAYAIAIVIAASVATARVTSPRRVAAAIMPLITIIYGTMAVLVGTIRYPWAYKHVGVIRLFDETGHFHPDVDIYNSFSGFFGLGALVRGATGVDPTSYAAWTQLVAESFILVAVWLLVRRATDSERVAHLAAVFYLITNWVGQNYFAAQTIATFLSLAVLGLITSWFMDGPTRPFRLVRRRLGNLAPTTETLAQFANPIVRRFIVLFVFLGLMMSHPLTPAVVLGAVGAAWIVGWMRDRFILVGVFVIAAGWVVRSYSYFATQSFDLGFGGSPATNADGNLDYSTAPDAVVAVGNLTRVFSVSVWLFAAIGALLCAWAMRRTGVLIIAACIPFGIPLVQSYGGEVIYRVYLYSLPLMVAFIAWGIITTTSIEARRIPRTTILASVVSVLLGAGFLIAHYGRERINRVDASEVAMDTYIAENVPDPAVLAQFDGTYPAASSARYPSFQVNDTYTPYVVDMVESSPAQRTVLPTVAQLDHVADDLFGLNAGVPYVIVSPGMIDSVEQLAALPIHSTQEAVDLMLTSGRFVVRHRIDDSWLLEVLP